MENEKTIENDFDKAVEFIVKSEFNKNLNKCLDVVKELEERDEEIERLNNIINELEKTLLELHEFWKDNDEYQWQYKNAYDYLQELKGSGVNE